MNELFKERFTRGLLAGIIASIVVFSWNYISYKLLNFSTLVYGDFAAAFIFRRVPTTMWEMIYSQAIAFMFSTFMGVVFIYLILLLNSRYLLLKGWAFGMAIWFTAYSLSIMFKIPTLTAIPIKTALSNMIGASIFGLTVAYTLNYFENFLIKKV